MKIAERHPTLIAELVRQSPIAVSPTITLRGASELLESYEIGSLLVHSHGRFIGIVSEHDVVRALADGADPDRERVEDVMTVDLARADVTCDIRDVACLMLDNEIRHVVLEHNGNVVGLVSMRDVVRSLIGAG